MRRRLVAIVAGCVLFTGTSASTNASPAELADSWVYPYLYELRLRHPGCPVIVTNGPHPRVEIARWLDRCHRAELLSDARSAWLYDMLRKEFAGEIGLEGATQVSWAGATLLGSRAENGEKVKGDGFARFALYSPRGLCLWTSLRVTVNDPEGHKTETEVWGGRGRASLEHGGIGYSSERFSLFFGRDEVSWGASRQRGLLFSGSAPSFDMLRLAFGNKRFRFSSFHSQLRQGKDDPWRGIVRRFVSGHRLDMLITDEFTFSVSEAVIYGGHGRTFEPVYLNPLAIFYAEQWNSGWNDNILIAGDFSVLLPAKMEVRGELMIDDFQYDFGNEPHEFAAGLTVTAVNPLATERSLVGGSYFHVRNQTYGHYVEWNRFIHEGIVMGYPDGPDGDRFEIWSSLALPDPLLWTLDYSYRRQGEGRATDCQLWKGPRVKFPSGIVETTHRGGLVVSWRPAHAWFVNGRVEYFNKDNVENVEGQSDDGLNFGIELTFSYKLSGGLGE